MIQLLHISDTHAFAEGTRDAVALSRQLGIPLVHTGDMVQDYYGQDITYAYPGAMLFCIGNHDVWTKTLPRQYTEQSKLYAMMRDDLARDLAVIEKQKTDAYDKIKTSTDNINEIANRLIKEAH